MSACSGETYCASARAGLQTVNVRPARLRATRREVVVVEITATPDSVFKVRAR
jgi:hypothetical protein